MKTKVYDFLDTKTGKQYYSFQVNYLGKWQGIKHGGMKQIFDTEAGRDTTQAIYRLMKESSFEININK